MFRRMHGHRWTRVASVSAAGALAVLAACVLFFCTLRTAAATCYYDCKEVTQCCSGYTIIVEPGVLSGWNVIGAQYSPAAAFHLWDPNVWDAVEDNFFSGQWRETGTQFVPVSAGWPCNCAAPDLESGGEVPTTGGPVPTGDFQNATYHQYCNPDLVTW